MLERSKMADLVVCSNTCQITDPALIKEVFDNHAARIREIDLCGLRSSFLSLLLENVQPSSLRLRSLQLSNLATSRKAGDDEFPLFPAHLLVQPDGLRRLAITHCAFDVYAQPLTSLTNLMVESPINRPLLPEFLTALARMPALETLEMIDSLPLAVKGVKSGLRVELPKLSFLHLSSTKNFFEVLNVLESLIVPWTARFKISCMESPLQQTDLGSRLELFFSS
jgi:hypothetical protein